MAGGGGPDAGLFGGFGGYGQPGYISPFDQQAAQFGEQQSEKAMTNRYQQLGLGAEGATPTSPGSFGAGPTAMQMDIGTAPSLTGGIMEEFQAMLGQLQTNDIGLTSGMSQGKSSGKGGK